VEAAHPAVLAQVRDSELQLGLHHGDGGDGASLAVEVREGGEIDVGDPVRVGGRERLVADHILRKLDPAAGRGVEPGVDATDVDPARPRAPPGPPLDPLALVAGQEQEPPESLLGVDTDHVPEDGPTADFDERLRDRLRSLAEARPAAAAEDHNWVQSCHRHTDPSDRLR
jgi:hypothetical protein